jgi:hypothetical protein
MNFSAFNYFNEAVNFPLENNGRAKVYGVDFTLEKKIGELYLIASASLFNSMYEINKKYVDARFNVRQNYVLTAGKEFRLRNQNKFFSINFRANYRNGLREPLNHEIQNQYSYGKQISAYSRYDLRLSFRKNKTRSSHIWALDIQNVTNQQNISYHYFDNFTNQSEARYQLGVIPVLSYKILF